MITVLNKVQNLLKKSDEEDIYEHCAICKSKTHVLKAEASNKRNLYVTGVGQLCYNCWIRAYADKTGKITFFPD